MGHTSSNRSASPEQSWLSRLRAHLCCLRRCKRLRKAARNLAPRSLTKSHFRFLDLPPEIRNQIYKECLRDTKYIHIQAGGSKIGVPSIMKTNRQIFQECLGTHLRNDFWLVELKKVTIKNWMTALSLDASHRLARSGQQTGLWLPDRFPETVTTSASALSITALRRYMYRRRSQSLSTENPRPQRLTYFYPSLTFHTDEETSNRVTINCMYTQTDQHNTVLSHGLGRGAPLPVPAERFPLIWLLETFSQYECFMFWSLQRFEKWHSDIKENILKQFGRRQNGPSHTLDS